MPFKPTGDVAIMASMADAAFVARLRSKFVAANPDECWPWLGAINGLGRATIWVKAAKTQLIAARVLWIVERGEIPEGQWVCHRCDNPACVNLSHMFLGTHLDNMRDMAAKGRNRPRRAA